MGPSTRSLDLRGQMELDSARCPLHHPAISLVFGREYAPIHWFGGIVMIVNVGIGLPFEPVGLQKLYSPAIERNFPSPLAMLSGASSRSGTHWVGCSLQRIRKRVSQRELVGHRLNPPSCYLSS